MTKMEGEAAASLTLTRTNVENNAPALSFDLTSSGTVTSGDYTVQSLTVTFAAGSSQATYSVTINDDNVHEPSETLVLTLPASSAGMQSMGMKTFTLTIQDNDSKYVK
ncbi:uncharacterized protein LOC121392137 [Gigantopelta aegis]|uniref:uncharacterized protein LOC121392137 n=1 Tax=Gigantopelta aegis TaxID=1735272 RepID=UPI001B8899D0|nr:uncharacterized protein LOC121392137 [Gigantopelta aegis]